MSSSADKFAKHPFHSSLPVAFASVTLPPDISKTDLLSGGTPQSLSAFILLTEVTSPATSVFAKTG